MEYTQNYALRKPGLNEYANVGDLNFNADKIDSQMKKNQDVDGEVYDPTSTSANAYEAGDYVINPDDGLMYVCNDTTYGPWDATKWNHTTEFEELQKAMASGGESELANLQDVEITNPTDGQALLYDDTTDKWHNSDLPDADVTKEASGNPIEFSDGADAPLVKCVTQITGSQDLHGYDKPWVGGAGKNKIDLIDASLESGSVIISNGTIKINGSFSNKLVNLSSYINLDYLNDTIISNQITYSITIVDGEFNASTVFFSAQDSTYYIQMSSSTGKTTTTPTKELTAFRLFLNGTIDAEFKLQIEFGSSATTWEPYSNICPITAYTEGEIEVRGKNLLDPALITFNSSGYVFFTNMDSLIPSKTYTLSFAQGIGDGRVIQYDSDGNAIDTKSFTESVTTFTVLEGCVKINGRYKVFDGTTPTMDTAQPQIETGTTATTYEPYTSTTHTTTYPSAIYRGSEDVVKGEVTTEWGMIASYAGETLPGEWISDRDEYAPGTTPTTGAQVAYELATPTTSSVTPTNLPIKSLSGYNHIESSTGEMEIEYFPQKEQPLIDLIPEASNMHEYSTAEHAVGTWIDGETIYEKTYSFTNDIIVTTEWTSTGITSDGIDAIIDSVVGHTTGQTWNGMGCLKDGGYLKLVNPYGGPVGINYLVIQYTKPTVTRSLAKGGGEPEEPQETKEEQVEELKEELEEAKEELVEEVKEEVKEEETIDPETNEEEKR